MPPPIILADAAIAIFARQITLRCRCRFASRLAVWHGTFGTPRCCACALRHAGYAASLGAMLPYAAALRYAAPFMLLRHASAARRDAARPRASRAMRSARELLRHAAMPLFLIFDTLADTAITADAAAVCAPPRFDITPPMMPPRHFAAAISLR